MKIKQTKEQKWKLDDRVSRAVKTLQHSERVTEREKQLVANLERVDSRLALLEPVWEAAKEWRLACARKGSTPEEVGGLWAVFVDAIDAAVAKEEK